MIVASALQEAITASNQKADAYAERITTLEGQLSENESTVSAHAAEVTELRRMLAAEQEAVHAAEATATAAKAQEEAMAEKCTGLEGQMEALQARLCSVSAYLRLECLGQGLQKKSCWASSAELLQVPQTLPLHYSLGSN